MAEHVYKGALIVDVQGFRGVAGEFIPKEMAVVALTTSTCIGHWIFMPPFSFDELPRKSRRTNEWLSRYFHGIEWFDGETHVKYLTRHLRELTRFATSISTRGKEKAIFLQTLLSRNVYNLESITPAFKHLPLWPSKEEKDTIQCSYHRFRSPNSHCALKNALMLREHLIKELPTLSHFPPIPDKEEEEEEEEDDISCADDDDDDDDDDNDDDDESKPTTLLISVNKDGTRVVQAKPKILYRTKNQPLFPLNEDNDSTKKVRNGYSQFMPSPSSRSSSYQNNEYEGNITSTATTTSRTRGRVPSRQDSEGVDEVDGNCCQHGQP